MKFAYRAFDKSGASVTNRIDAASLIEAGETLRRQGLFVTEINPSNEASGSVGQGARPGGRGGNKRDVALLVRQLGVLVATGTPLVDALASLERQLTPGGWKSAVMDIRKRVEEGSPLSHALESHPKYFDPVARSLIAAGESGGQLDRMLKELALLLRAQVKVRSAILGALAYPTLLIFISINVLITLLVFVLPRFEDLFKNLGAPLPPTTKMLMDLSKALVSYWYIALLLAGGMIVGSVIWLKSSRGKAGIDWALVSLPMVGKVSRSLITARIARVFGVLLEGRVPMLDALGLTREAAGNMLYQQLITKAENAVTRGETISSALENSPLMSSAFVEGIRSGERSGQLASVLKDLSSFMDEDNDVILRSLASVIEPLILMVLGVVIGFVAISMFMPLFDIASAAQQGGNQ